MPLNIYFWSILQPKNQKNKPKLQFRTSKIAKTTVLKDSKYAQIVFTKIAHCGKFRIFLLLRFYVKSISGILEVQNLQF